MTMIVVGTVKCTYLYQKDTFLVLTILINEDFFKIFTHSSFLETINGPVVVNNESRVITLFVKIQILLDNI